MARKDMKLRRKKGGEAVSKKKVTAPVRWQSDPTHPATHLAYITDAERELLARLDMHGSGVSMQNPHYGPQGIPSLNGMGGPGDRGALGGGAPGTGGMGPGGRGGTDGYGGRDTRGGSPSGGGSTGQGGRDGGRGGDGTGNSGSRGNTGGAASSAGGGGRDGYGGGGRAGGDFGGGISGVNSIGGMNGGSMAAMGLGVGGLGRGLGGISGVNSIGGLNGGSMAALGMDRSAPAPAGGISGVNSIGGLNGGSMAALGIGMGMNTSNQDDNSSQQRGLPSIAGPAANVTGPTSVADLFGSMAPVSRGVMATPGLMAGSKIALSRAVPNNPMDSQYSSLNRAALDASIARQADDIANPVSVTGAPVGFAGMAQIANEPNFAESLGRIANARRGTETGSMNVGAPMRGPSGYASADALASLSSPRSAQRPSQAPAAMSSLSPPSRPSLGPAMAAMSARNAAPAAMSTDLSGVPGAFSNTTDTSGYTDVTDEARNIMDGNFSDAIKGGMEKLGLGNMLSIGGLLSGMGPAPGRRGDEDRGGSDRVFGLLRAMQGGGGNGNSAPDQQGPGTVRPGNWVPPGLLTRPNPFPQVWQNRNPWQRYM